MNVFRILLILLILVIFIYVMTRLLVKRQQILAMKIVDRYRTNIIDISGDSIVFEVIGTSEMIDKVLNELSFLGLEGISRTGVVAGFKGDKKLNQLDTQY